MKIKHCYFPLLFMLISLSGCLRLATTPTVDLSRFTPQISETINVDPPKGERTPILTLDPETEEALQMYPLWVGSTWVYDYLGYDQDIEVIWRVIETVIDSNVVEGHYVVKMERTANVIEGIPPVGFRSAPETGIFWYLVDGNNLYRFDNESNFELSEAWLELVLPFPDAGEAWVPDPDQRGLPEPAKFGYCDVSDPFKGVLPMGGMYTCYNIAMHNDDQTFEQTFCENVGFVYRELHFYSLSYGYRVELKGFLLQ